MKAKNPPLRLHVKYRFARETVNYIYARAKLTGETMTYIVESAVLNDKDKWQGSGGAQPCPNADRPINGQ